MLNIIPETFAEHSWNVRKLFSAPAHGMRQAMELQVPAAELQESDPAMSATDSARPSFVLTMIVKNESRILRRCLEAAAGVRWGEAKAPEESLSRLVSAVCIVDTGSTDDTAAVAEQAGRDLGLPLRVVNDPWVNFGHNRSRSFLRAAEFASNLGWDLGLSYALLIDADMVLQTGEAGFGWRALRGGDKSDDGGPPAGATFMQRAGSLEYFNVRLVRLDLPWRCVGSTHEYWTCPGREPRTVAPEFIYIRDVGDGGAKADKFERDIRLLTAELEQDPTNVRAHFYLAQSLHHCGRLEEAVASYERRIALGGWWEERWYAKLALGRVLLRLGRVYEAECWLQRAAEQNKARAEPLAELATAFRVRGDNLKAAHYARAAASRPAPKQGLFVEIPAHTHRPLYERTILDYYLLRATSPSDALHASLRYLAATPGVEHADSALANLPYYLRPLGEETGARLRRGDGGPFGASSFRTVGETRFFPDSGEFTASSVSVMPNFGPRAEGRIWANVRYVNYRMAPRNAKGGKDIYTDAAGREGRPVQTRNALALLEPATLLPNCCDSPPVFWEPALPPRRESMIGGLEDVRLEGIDGGSAHAAPTLLFSASQRQWSRGGDVYRIAVGKLDAAEARETSMRVVSSPEKRGCEKNWVAAGGGRHIYAWGPELVVGRVVDAGAAATSEEEAASLEIVARHPAPWLWSKFRGSSNASWHRGLLYFVVHLKYYNRPAEGAMTYVHALVALDPASLAPRRTSQPFYFARKDDVEYCLGLDVSFGGVARMWFSSRDAEPALVSVPLDSLRWVDHE